MVVRETPPHAWGRRFHGLFYQGTGRNTPTCVGKTGTRRQAWWEYRKHPHMRGEDRSLPFVSFLLIETPPHAWGRPPKIPPPTMIRRNTPTCVGKTRFLFHVGSLLGKHPHMRGEDRGGEEDSARLQETPPHAWGRQSPAASRPGKSRNTPTCVGKTFSESSLPVQRQETPPHAWGRHDERAPVAQRLGNTPTCVGKTGGRLFPSMRWRKHPHMRGEDRIMDSRLATILETPPHAWGRLQVSPGQHERKRNTPTCVGKTFVFFEGFFWGEKHPHMRGEDRHGLDALHLQV